MKIPTFLKWAGGKRRLIGQIDPHLPKEIETYFEPFLGGGSMFFYVKQKYNPKKSMISDINKDLIETFVAVRDEPLEIIKYLKILRDKNSKDFYYKIREGFNQGKIYGLKRSAAFIYLNKTCFNGLYRVNSKNEFNVPYGSYKNPEIFDEATIFYASKLLKGTTIRCQDYTKIVPYIKNGDFIYLDPCYDPLKKTSFANYTPKRFNDEDNDRLLRFINDIKNKEGLVLLSNNLTKGVKNRYPKKEGFYLKTVQSPRFINSIGSKRGNINEALIKTY